jgi:hypothetical protein
MSRPLVLLLGTVLWVSFGVVVLFHIQSGEWESPFAAVVVVATVFSVYHARRRMSATAEQVTSSR